MPVKHYKPGEFIPKIHQQGALITFGQKRPDTSKNTKTNKDDLEKKALREQEQRLQKEFSDLYVEALLKTRLYTGKGKRIPYSSKESITHKKPEKR